MLERLGRYEILERIAAGGQGTVYRARDTVLDRVVAVKVINQQVADDPAYLEALQREARLAAGLDHPNITTVYDFQVEDGTAFIVMELVPDALDKHISQGRALPWRRAVEIAAQVAQALQHAHDKGVVHRDIKPSNVLLREGGEASVSDFGIARAFASSTRSRTTSVTGTPPYMAPEQWSGGPVDGRLDQYALGIVLYEMIAGRLPFQGDSMEALFVQHREAPMPPLPANLQVPSEVESVIRHATEKRIEDRYSSSGAMASELEGTLSGSAPASAQPPPVQPAISGPPSSPPQPPMSGGGHVGGFPKWAWWARAAGVTAVVAVVIAVVVAMGNGGSNDDDQTAQVLAPLPTPTLVPTFTASPTATPGVPVIAPIKTNTPQPTSTPTAFSHYVTGTSLFNAKEYTEAIDEFTLAIRLDPDIPYADLYTSRAFAYITLGQNLSAIKDYDESLRLDPNNASSYNNRGVAYYRLDQRNQAIQDYNRAIQLNPNDALFFNNRAEAYGDLGQDGQANADYTMACSLDTEYCANVALPTATPRPIPTPTSRPPSTPTPQPTRTPTPRPTATPRPTSTPVPPINSIGGLNYFTLGSHQDDVARVQGTPTAINVRFGGETDWSYGYSTVTFDTNSKLVIEWDESTLGSNLKFDINPGGNTTTGTTFTLGSHQDDVARVQGTPTAINVRFGGETDWSYGYSTVTFDTNSKLVIEWDESTLGSKLKIGVN